MAGKSGGKGDKLSRRAEQFAEEMANPATTSGAEAAVKAGYAEDSARVTASQLLTNPNVVERIEKRKAELADYANVTAAQVLGATALRAFATIDDAFDENGYFDIDKARETGAIHLVKKMSRTPNKYGEAVVVEFYSNESAQDKLGSYLGLEQMPRQNSETIERAVQAYSAWLSDNPGATAEERATWVQRIAKGANIEPTRLAERVDIQIESVQ